MHYQEKLDTIFAKGNLWEHRTLRTVLDSYSSEYDETTLEEKLQILKTIQSSDLKLDSLILQYKMFYIKEGKRHVADGVEDGLLRLLVHIL